jgi:ribosomal-protein-alanine N-acetyltransferase
VRRLGGAGFLLAALFVTALALAQSPEAGPEGLVWLEYRLRQTVTNGTGEYEGWSDETTAAGRYEIGAREVWARYRWRYLSPDDERTGEEDRRVSFDPLTRLYQYRPIDLDDYDDSTAERLYVWWRIPTEVEVGATIQILDETFEVVGRVPERPDHFHRASILVESRGGIGERNDAYGRFTTTHEDQYWFDAETGWFLREERIEHDRGTLNGRLATFDVQETVEVTAASYLPGTTPTWARDAALFYSESSDDVAARSSERRTARTIQGALPWVGGGLLALLFGYVWWRRRPTKHDYQGKLEALGERDKIPDELSQLSPFFGELVPHLARQARAIGPVVIARGSQGIEGLALSAPAGEAATIFAPDTACCEALRQKIGATHFFSEVRHEHAFAARAAAGQHGVTLTGNHAYNVLETHELLKLEPLPEGASYDRKVVRRATTADEPAIIQVADAVYGGSNRAWIEAVSRSSDVLLVALDSTAPGEPVVGFAIVSVAGRTARFSGLTVAAGHRGKGLGKELNRARVRIAHDLGAERALVEVASHNTASLEIARTAGFTKVGSMFVETAAATETSQKFLRR